MPIRTAMQLLTITGWRALTLQRAFKLDRDAAHFLSAQDAKALADSFYARLEEAKRLQDLEDAAAAEKFDEEVREYQDYLEKEGLDEDYGSDETKDD